MNTRLPSVLVGREDVCGLILSGASVSRVHVEVQLLPDGDVYVTDCHSSGGTHAELHGQSRPVKQGRVSRDAVLVLGTTRLPVTEVVQFLERRGGAPAAPVGSRPSAPVPTAQVGEGKRVRCEHCAYVKIEGTACPNWGTGQVHQ